MSLLFSLHCFKNKTHFPQGFLASFLSAELSSKLRALFAQHLFIWRCEVLSLVMQGQNGCCCHSRCFCQKLLSEHKSQVAHVLGAWCMCVMEGGVEVKEAPLFTLPARIQTSSDSALHLPPPQLLSLHFMQYLYLYGDL